MQPAFMIILHEVGQKARRGAGAGRIGRAAGIVQFSKVGRQLAAVELSQRQAPESFVFSLRARQQAIRQRIIKAEQRVIIIAKRGFRRAGQRGGIDDQRRLLKHRSGRPPAPGDLPHRCS